MRVTEVEIDETIRRHLPGSAAEGAELAGVSSDDDPLKIVEAIQTFVADPPKRRWFKRVDNWTDRALPLGCLWGTQLERQFGWEWLQMIQHDHDDLKVMAVFDPRRTMGGYPFHYLFGCLENGVYPTVLLAFNLLIASEIPDFEPGEYVNVMDGVQHIVPPR